MVLRLYISFPRSRLEKPVAMSATPSDYRQGIALCHRPSHSGERSTSALPPALGKQCRVLKRRGRARICNPPRRPTLTCCW
eukprot:8422647-Pyramimonas_sp.AAC.1